MGGRCFGAIRAASKAFNFPVIAQRSRADGRASAAENISLEPIHRTGWIWLLA